MSVGKHEEPQGVLWLSYDQLPKSLGRPFTTACSGDCSKVALPRPRRPTSFVLTASTRENTANRVWDSPVDQDSRIAKLKDDRTHLATSPKMSWTWTAPAVVAVKIHQVDKGDIEIMHDILSDTKQNLKASLCKSVPKYDKSAILAEDKGNRYRGALVKLDSSFRSRVCEPERREFSHKLARGQEGSPDGLQQLRVFAIRDTKSLQRLGSERVERRFTHCLDNGGIRRTHLRGTENIKNASCSR